MHETSVKIYSCTECKMKLLVSQIWVSFWLHVDIRDKPWNWSLLGSMPRNSNYTLFIQWKMENMWSILYFVLYPLHYYFILYDSKIKVRFSLCLIKDLTMKKIQCSGDIAPHILASALNMYVINRRGQCSHLQHMPVYQWQNVYVKPCYTG